MPLPKAANTDPQLSLMSVARMCWIHRYGIAVAWLALTVATVAVVQRMPAVYTAESLILIDAQKIPERFVPSTVSAEAEDRLATISQQILSNTDLQRIVEEDDLYREQRARHPLDEVVQTMRADINVRLDRGMANTKPNAFRVSYSGTQPAVVAQVTNQLANLFIEENLRTRESQAEGTSEFVGTELAEAKKKLDSLETAIRGYKSLHNGELPEQRGALEGALERLRMEQVSAADAISRAEESKATLENTERMTQDTLDMLMRPPSTPAPANAPSTGASAAAAAPPAPSGPKRQSEILQAQLEDMLGRYGEQHPDVKRLRAEIKLAKAAEAREAAQAPLPKGPARGAEKVTASDTPAQALAKAVTANPVDVGAARERMAALKSQLAVVENDIDRRKADQQRIAKEITEYQTKLTDVPMREQELDQITRDYDVTKLNYHSLLEKQLSAEMSTDMERRQKSERFTILDPAHAPQTPSKPNRMFYDATSSALFLFLAITGAIGLEMRKGSLMGEWELPENIPVLARVPEIAISGGGVRLRAGWSAATWVIVASVALISLVGLAAARFYLGSGF
jgi:polysaccharide chain length determinant protein (PEP-CTERM system associated)